MGDVSPQQKPSRERSMTMPKPHARLEMLQERFGSGASAISLGGFIGPSAKGLVRLFPTPTSSDYIELPEAALLHFEQDDVTGSVELFVDPLVIITVVSVRKVPLMGVALRQQNGGPDAGTGKTCLEKKIEACKSDPLVHNKAFCDSEAGKHVFQLLCDLFDSPKFGELGSVIV
jgi:hypothetical protein